MNQRLAFPLVFLAAFLSAASNADTFFTPLSLLPAGTSTRGDGPYTTGNTITVAGQNLVVDKLGAMDVYSDGFYAPVQVGLWTGNGATLLGTVTVTSADPISGGYRYHALASPVILTAATTYMIAARVGSGIEWFYDASPNTLATANPAILLGDACFNGATGLAAPTNSSGFTARWAAANATFVFTNSPATNGYTTTINPNSSWGTWDGWGVSLCWWANVFGNRDDLADIMFTTNYTILNNSALPGLGMNITRYNAGGCSSNSIDGTTMQVSPNIPSFRQIQGYWLDWNSTDPSSASWNWSADANQRAMLLKAKARGANWLELFSNSPMWWMCNNHNPSGANSGLSDNLQSWNYDQHAIYLATVAKYAKDNWGVTFNSVEAFNEPIANWWTSTGTQEGCHFARTTQASVIGYLRSELDNRGLTSINIAASDENTYDGALATWNSFNSTAKGQINRVNTHGYQYGSGRRDLLYSGTTGKKLWNSEYGESDGTGMSLASNLNLDLRWLHPTGWCYWQALDSGGWGLIQSNPGDNYIGPANRKYFVLAQYTRHIRPGMTIIDGGESNTVAAYNPAKRKLALVTANYGTAQWVTYNLSDFLYASGPVQRWTTVTGAGPSYQRGTDITLSQRTFKAWFPANSVQTFEIQSVDLNPPATPSNLSANAGVGRVSLTWTASANATNYILERMAGVETNIISILSQTNYLDSAVVAGTTYTYAVEAVNGAGKSSPSAPASATPYASPCLIAQIQTEGGQLKLSWPAWARGFALYGTAVLTPPIQWSPVTNVIQTNVDAFYMTLPPPNGEMYFYKLKELL